jgi:hypothetical protein
MRDGLDGLDAAADYMFLELGQLSLGGGLNLLFNGVSV